MRRYDVISEICDYMLELGWGPYQNDHEDANGQFEMNWNFDDALITADRHAFFKYMVKAIAEKHGLRATFMPKPFLGLTGNGCHVHISVWQGQARTCSSTARTRWACRAGLQFPRRHHERRERALLRSPTRRSTPTSASTRRARSPGATWSPNTVTYAGNNRTHMVRSRATAASSCACRRRRQSLSAAGGDHRRRPRRHRPQARSRQAARHRHVCRRPHGAGRTEAAAQSARCAAHHRGLGAAARELGDEFVDAYIKLKTPEWNSYARHLTEWERDNTLDC